MNFDFLLNKLKKNNFYFKISKEINIILFFISFSDLLTMSTTMPYNLHFNLIHGKELTNAPSFERDTKSWVLFMKIHLLSSTTFHSISVWLTVYLAYFRYFKLRGLYMKEALKSFQRQSSRLFDSIILDIKIKLFRYKQILSCILLIFIFNILICLPEYLFLTVKEESYEDQVFYFLDESDLNFKTKGLIFKMVFYSQSIFGKFIPCIFLIIFTGLLIHKLVMKKRGLKKLFEFSTLNGFDVKHLKIQSPIGNYSMNKANNSFSLEGSLRLSRLASVFNKGYSNEFERVETASITTETTSFSKYSTFSTNKLTLLKKRNFKKLNRNNRASTILMAICIIFLIAELPLSNLTFLSITMGDAFYEEVYMPLGDIMEMIVLISSSVNFILYCSMSKAFRKAFFSFFYRRKF